MVLDSIIKTAILVKSKCLQWQSETTSSYSFQDIPAEIHGRLSLYLGVIEYYHLSQTLAGLRDIYHPILFRNCCLNSQEFSNLKSSLLVYSTQSAPHRKWVIPSKVFYEPSKFSWFDNMAVTSITLDQFQSIEQVLVGLKLSLYPHLKSILIPHDNESSLILTDTKIEKNIYLKNMVFKLNDVLPVFKTPYYHFPVNLSQDKNPSICGSLAFTCTTMDTKASITSLNIDMLKVGSEPKNYNYCCSFLNLEVFPELKHVHILFDESVPTEIFEKVIKSLLNCIHLENVHISYYSANSSAPILQVLDNLIGSWKTFTLDLSCPEITDYIIRLPSVTTISTYICTDSDPVIIFGDKIKTAKFYFNGIKNPFELQNIINSLENLTSLSLKWDPETAPLSLPKRFPIFAKDLFNLKKLSVSFGHMKTFSNIESVILNDFKLIIKAATFGDFDILNKRHMEPLVKCLAFRFKENNANVEVLAKVKNGVKAILDAIQNSNLYETLYRYFELQYDGFTRSYNSVENTYAVDKTFVSLLCIDILHHLPNLRELNFTHLSSIEEYPTLHQLIKYHKGLEKIVFEGIRYPLQPLEKRKDEFYKKLCKYYRSHPQLNTDANLNIDMKVIHGHYHDF